MFFKATSFVKVGLLLLQQAEHRDLFLYLLRVRLHQFYSRHEQDLVCNSTKALGSFVRSFVFRSKAASLQRCIGIFMAAV